MSEIPITLQETLSQLKDIHLPNDSLWWPPAPGVVVLSFFTLVLCILMCVKIIQFFANYYYNRRIYLAISQLNAINQNKESKHAIEIISELSVLLKRCAIAKYGQTHEVKSLSGHSWLEFLNRTGQTDQFTQPHGQLLITLPYLKEINYLQYNEAQLQNDIKQIIKLSRQWIDKNL